MTVRGSWFRHGAATNTQAQHPLNWSSRGPVPTQESFLLNSRTHPRAHTLRATDSNDITASAADQASDQ